MTEQQLIVKRKVISYVKGRGFKGQDLEDVLQEIWASLYLAYPNYIEQGYLIPWAIKIASHSCVDFFRDRCKDDKQREAFRQSAHELIVGDINPNLVEKEILFEFLHKLSANDSNTTSVEILKAYFIEHKSILCISKENHISRKIVTRMVKQAASTMRVEFLNIYDDSYECIDKIVRN